MNKAEVIKMFKQFPTGMYIRTLPDDKRVHGFFDNSECLEDALSELDEDTTLYYNGQVLKEEAFGKFPLNQFAPVGKGAGLKNEDITELQYICMDIDVSSANKESADKNDKLNATNDENNTALTYAGNMGLMLEQDGFRGIGYANSGNGAYIIIPFKRTPCTDSLVAVIKCFVSMLAESKPNDLCHLDVKTLNPARIFKLAGTLSKKGIPTEENPWRYATMIQDIDFSRANDWEQISDYIDTHSLPSNLMSVASNGQIQWDLDNVCEAVIDNFEVCRDQFGRMYATFNIQDTNTCYNLEKEEIRTVLREWLRLSTSKKHIPSFVIDASITMMIDEARSSEEVTLYHRLKKTEQKVLYALGQDKPVVCITPNSVELVSYPPKTFLFEEGDLQQIEPDLSVKPTEVRELMKPLFNVQEESQQILLLTFLGTSLFVDCSFPILFIEGEKGSSKSTTCKLLQKIISPKKAELYSFPTTEKDLGIILSKESFLCFDNLGGIKNTIADLLCQAVTGGFIKTRKLFTDDDVVVRSVKTILVLNGISYLSQREDLTDRVLMIRQKRLCDVARKTDRELEEEFERVRPKILGGLFNAVSEAFNIEIEEPTVRIRTLDFEKAAIKIGIALGYTQEEVEKAFKENKDTLIQDLIEENPLTNMLVGMMKGRDSMSYTATELFNKLHTMYEGKKVLLPGSPSMVSRKLGQLRSDLQNVGITFELDTSNGKKQVFFNDGSYVPNRVDNYKQKDILKMEKRKELVKPDED